VQDVLYHGEVRLPRIVHMEADLLDSVADVGAGECHVLEGPGEAHDPSQISNKRPKSIVDLDLCVHGRRDWLAVYHDSALKDVEIELVLSEE
jgi:hypothetical protein